MLLQTTNLIHYSFHCMYKKNSTLCSELEKKVLIRECECLGQNRVIYLYLIFYCVILLKQK